MEERAIMHKKRLRLFTLLPFGLLGVLCFGTWGVLLRMQRQYDLDRSLIAALTQQDYEQALALVKKGADPNTTYDPPQRPSLRRMMDYLIHRSLPWTDMNPTAFVITCRGYPPHPGFGFRNSFDPSRPVLVEAMLKHGANLQAKNDNDATPLVCAVSDPGIVRILLDHGADADPDTASNPLVNACLMGAPVSVRLLLEHGADPNGHRQAGFTPLEAAAQVHSSEKTRMLLARGADINARHDGGVRLLYLVLSNSWDNEDQHEIAETLSLLLAHGADPNAPGGFGSSRSTVLQFATNLKHPHLVAILKKAGAKK